MAANPNDDEEVFDDTPAFIDMNSAVEVDVPDANVDDADDDDAMMDDEAMADADEALASKMEGAPPTPAAIVDQSKATFNSHTDAVYAVASHYDLMTHTLSIASGGGDDRAYLHHVTTSAAADGTPQLAQTTAPLSHPHTDSISCVAFNTPYIDADVSGKVQKNLLAVGSYDGSIVLYDPSNGDLVTVLEGPSDVEWTTFHPKGGTVLLAGSVADGTIWMYHCPSKSCLQVFVGHEGGVTAGAFTPDGKLVVTVGQDGTCRVWAPKTGMSKHVFRLMEQLGGVGDGQPGPGLTCLAVGGGQDGKMAICGGEDGKAYVVHVSGKKLVATLPHFEVKQQQQQHIGDGMDDEDMEEEARSVEAVGFCPPDVPGTAGWCATGGVDGVLKVWNISSGAAQLRQRCAREDRPDSGITRLRWHASLPLVLCSYTDGTVGAWDARSGGMVGSMTGHGDMINDMSVSFVGGSGGGVAAVATGSDDRSVKMFEFRP